MMNTRDRLLDAARACLLELGHQASSVKAIAARAEVNHGLVHHYFGSKEGLWVAVIAREAERVRASLEAAPATFMDGFYIPEVLRHPDRVRLGIEFLALAKANPAVSAVLCEHFRLNRAMLCRRFGITDEAMGTLLFAALFGLVIHAGLDPELPVERAAHTFLRMVSSSADTPGMADAAALALTEPALAGRKRARTHRNPRRTVRRAEGATS